MQQVSWFHATVWYTYRQTDVERIVRKELFADLLASTEEALAHARNARSLRTTVLSDHRADPQPETNSTDTPGRSFHRGPGDT